MEISTVNGPYSGSSMAAALTAGACAQLMQWCVAENNYREFPEEESRRF
ncbi:MAG: hypothetical protein ACLURV_00525 [Gallintestinimicrobium sp.]